LTSGGVAGSSSRAASLVGIFDDFFALQVA
jgi:hypothetical protein